METAVSPFDISYNVAKRARQELSQSGHNEVLVPTRRLFRRSRRRMSGAVRRRGNWHVALFLLPGPNYTQLPTPKQREDLDQIGFGRPLHETGEDKRSQIKLNWSLAELAQFVYQSYPQVSLNLSGFELARANKGRELIKLQVNSVKELKEVTGRSRLYILPLVQVFQGIDAGEPNGAYFAVGQHAPPLHWSPAPPLHWSPAPPLHWSPTPPPHWSPAPPASPLHWSPAPPASSLHWSPASPPHWSPESPPFQPALRALEDSESSSTEINLQTVLLKLLSRVDLTSNGTNNQINVCRDDILQGSLQAFRRRRFNPGAKLDVIFVDGEGTGEGAVDNGGPTREYLRLLMRAIQHSKIFDGPENDRLLALDTHGLDTGLYMLIGQMVTVCLIHGGVGPQFFSKRLFLQLCGKSPPPASLDEVGNRSFREELLKIKAAETVREANDAIIDADDSLSMMGTLRYITSLEQRDSLVQSAADYFVDGRIHVALTQFEEGLKTLGFLDELRAHPEIFEDLFTNVQKPLEAKDLATLFEVDFSAPGSNRRHLENQTIGFWRDWLIDVQEGECSHVTLEMVLEFVSGASTVPPLGFPLRPLIEFLHDEDTKIFPEANTCITVLRLPIHNQYEKFSSCMTDGIVQSLCFGIA